MPGVVVVVAVVAGLKPVGSFAVVGVGNWAFGYLVARSLSLQVGWGWCS